MGAATLLREGSIVGSQKSRYEVMRLLDSGGMGYVWLARDLLSDEEVIIKEPKQFAAAIQKITFEVKLLSMLRHRNIVGYLDHFSLNNVSILVEEYVRGPSLHDVVKKEGPLDEVEAVFILSQLLLAADYIHSHNVIHRDIKPRNILVDEDLRPETAKLIDFGTATYYNVAGINEIVFSQGGYTAPEQYYRRPLPQSDIWSIMATGFYLLTGKDPTVLIGQEYYKYGMRASADPGLLRRDLSDHIRRVIEKGMRWNVLDRYLTAREAFDELTGHAYRVDQPVLEVMGIVVPIKTPRLIFGRKPATSRGETYIEPAGREVIADDPKKVVVIEHGDVTFVGVYDPYRWISSYHFEIAYYGGSWCIRDLGSTNRTAVITRAGIREIWVGRRTPGPCYPLEDRAIILVAYGSSINNTPYVTVVFRRG